MITRSDDYVEYCRETAQYLRDVQDLALRGKNKQEITRLIQERIVRERGRGRRYNYLFKKGQSSASAESTWVKA